MSRLLLVVLLLCGGTADGDQNSIEMEVVSPVQKGHSSVSGHIVVEEGSSMLIECNVTGGHDDFKWFNSKGPLLGEDSLENQF